MAARLDDVLLQMPQFSAADVPIFRFRTWNRQYSPSRAKIAPRDPAVAGQTKRGTPMSRSRKESIKKIRDLLVLRRDAMRRALAGDLSMLQELQSNSDVVDAALDAAQDEISSQLAEVESRELASIEKALERVREDCYGDCEFCEKKIPMARLNALPYATMCIECQQAAEDGTLDDRRDEDWSRVVDTGYSDSETRVNDFELQ